MNQYKIIKNYLTQNKYSRPGTKIDKMKGIVIHWVANPGTSAAANRNFFESRKARKKGYGSAHEIIDLNGDVVLCIPLDEMAYGAGSETYTKRAQHYLGKYPNNCTYHIECTHVDLEGRMTPETYNTLIHRVVDLCIRFELKPHFNQDLWLHQEVVGWKDCHRLFVRNTTLWHDFQKRAGEIYDFMMRGEVIVANLKLENQWQWDMLEDSIQDLMKKGTLNNAMWLEKVRAKSITADELSWLNTIIIASRMK